MNLLRRLFGKPQAAPAEDAAPDETRQMKINAATLHAASQPTDASQQRQAITPYEPPEGVVPGGREGKQSAMAMDSTPYDFLNLYGFTGAFPGYPYLADLSQRPEYRKMTGIIAEEMTRKWVELKATGEDADDKADKIKRIEDAVRRFQVRERFREAAENDGYFGRGQLYFEVKTPSGTLASESPDELEQPLFLDKAKIKKGSLVEIRNVEPVWTYPGAYQATDPLQKDYYEPQKWFVMGKTVHVSRFCMFISRPLPDMLKPAYNFGGLSLSQIAEPYVNNWLRTRNSVGDLIHSFSLSILKTDMASALQGGAGQELFNRIDLFNRVRDNRGAMAIDKNSEDIEQINTPLSGLHELQAQSQEHMSAVSSIPLVKFTGITPSGLNASSEGEIRVFYDHIHAQQENLFRQPLKKTLDILQLHEFGEIDPDITFEFVSLHELSEKEEAEIEEKRATTHDTYVAMGAVDPDEVRQSLANDPDSPYQGLDLSSAAPGDDGEDGLASDAAFKEQDHPRDSDGKFTDGGSSSIRASENGGSTQIARSDSLSRNIAKAEKSGFDTDEIYVHSGTGLEEIKATGNFPGIFALEEDDAGQAEHYGESSYSFVVKGGVWDDDDLSGEISDNEEEVEEYIKRELRNEGIDDDQMESIIDVVNNESLEYDEGVADLLNAIDEADFYKEAQSLRAKVASFLGGGAIRMEDEFNTDTVMLLPGDKVMMISRPGVEDDR